jgi:hypothetical protein
MPLLRLQKGESKDLGVLLYKVNKYVNRLYIQKFAALMW